MSRPAPVVLRGRFGVVTTGLLAALFAWLLIDAAAHGAWTLVLLALPWLLAVLALCWTVLVRPRLEVRPDGLRIVNLLREHHVPWDDIDDLRVKYQLLVELVDGRVLRAWGSPTVERPRFDSAAHAGTRAPRFTGVVNVIENARDEIGTVPAHGWTRVAWWPYAAIGGFVALGLLTRVLVG